MAFRNHLPILSAYTKLMLIKAVRYPRRFGVPARATAPQGIGSR